MFEDRDFVRTRKKSALKQGGLNPDSVLPDTNFHFLQFGEDVKVVFP